LTSTQATHPILDHDFVVGCKAIKDNQRICVRSKVLIDASGYRSYVCKAAGLHKGFRRFGVGAEYDLSAPHCSQDEAVLILGTEYAPSGYGRVFPWGNGRVRVGVGILHADSTADPRIGLELVVSRARKFNIDLSDYRVLEEHFGMVPSDGVAQHLVGNGIMAVGDAGGQASLVVGEGIRLCMKAGRIAGNSASEAIRQVDWAKDP
jgi:digeranylgeranylglycerophospholipid reductase